MDCRVSEEVDTIELMKQLIERAELGETECIEQAREALANALIHGTEVDEKALKKIALRVGKNGLSGQTEALLAWSPLASACRDYIMHRQVGMKDGRCATGDGWDYSNCEPGLAGQGKVSSRYKSED